MKRGMIPFGDVVIFVISLVLLIGVDIGNYNLSKIIYPFFIVALFVFIPLFGSYKFSDEKSFIRILEIYYRTVFLVTTIFPLFLLISLVNSSSYGGFHGSKIWLLFSYYYRLVVIYLIIFLVAIKMFPQKKVNNKNLSQFLLNKKLLIIYLFFLSLLPFFIDRVYPNSSLLKL